jgi:segregation and condensation protein B
MTTTVSIESSAEALLFYTAEPVAVPDLARLLGVGKEETLEALKRLQTALEGRGIQLVRIGECVELRTAPAAASLIEKLREDELSHELSRASLETLAFVLYEGPATRSEVEYARGVQSQSTLRALASRGLIEKTTERKGAGGVFYRATTAALAHFGLTSPEELPDYGEVRGEIEARLAR